MRKRRIWVAVLLGVVLFTILGPTEFSLISYLGTVEDLINAHEKLLVVLATIAIAGFTFTLWRATKGLHAAAGRQAEEMRESLNIAKKSADALIAAQRPWISGNVRLTSPMTFGPRGANVSVDVTTKNFGRSPAIRVSIWPQLIHWSTEEPFNIPAAIRDRRESVERQKQGVGFGFSLFPGETRMQSHGLDIKRSDIDLTTSGGSKPKVYMLLAIFIDYEFRRRYWMD